jgi:hypothetical protein
MVNSLWLEAQSQSFCFQRQEYDTNGSLCLKAQTHGFCVQTQEYDTNGI